MADDGGGVTLKIDADTAAYIAKIARAAEESKKLADGPKEAGEHFGKLADRAREVVGVISGIALPMSAASLAMGTLVTATEAWHEHLRRGADVMKEVTDLHSAFARAGMGGMSGKIEKAMKDAAPALDMATLGGVFGAITAPGAYPNATIDQISGLTKSAAAAKLAGQDPVAFTSLNAKLGANGVANADTLAYYAERYIAPDEQDQAVTASIEAPEQAPGLMQTFANPALSKNKGMKSTLNKVMADWLRRGKPGTFKEFLGSGHAHRVAGKEGRAFLSMLATGSGPAIDPHALASAGEDNEKDPALATKTAEEAMAEEEKRLTEEKYGGIAQRKALKAARTATAYFDNPLGDGIAGKTWNVVKGMFGDQDGGDRNNYAIQGGKLTMEEFLKRKPKFDGVFDDPSKRKFMLADFLDRGWDSFSSWFQGPHGASRGHRSITDALQRGTVKQQAQGEDSGK